MSKTVARTRETRITMSGLEADNDEVLVVWPRLGAGDRVRERDADEQPLPARPRDERRADRRDRGADPLALHLGVLQQVGALDLAEHGGCHGGAERVAAEGRPVRAGREEIARRAMQVAAEVCVFTNDRVTVEVI